jgi:hypothetical protein
MKEPLPVSDRPSVFSERSQIAILWWGIGLAVIYGLAFVFLLHMVPPPDPMWGLERIAAYYSGHRTSIVIGATICAWTGAFMLPILAVLAKQMARVEGGREPIWAWLSLVSGAMMSLFLALPPIMWGAAAFTSGRSADATSALHDLGMLTLVTTDQFYIFLWVAVSVTCWRPATALVSHNPFPRWWGYLSLWMTVMFEAGAFAFLTRTGPLAWDGLLAFWSPLTLFTLWIIIQCRLTLKALRGQMADKIAGQIDVVDATAS